MPCGASVLANLRGAGKAEHREVNGSAEPETRSSRSRAQNRQERGIRFTKPSNRWDFLGGRPADHRMRMCGCVGCFDRMGEARVMTICL